MDLSKQEMELFILLSGLLSKNFYYNIFFIITNEIKIDFQNRKGNYTNRKWNYLSYFQASYQKKFFYNIFFIFTRELKIDFQNRKWNYPNRKWNFLSYFQASDQKILLQNVSHQSQGVQNWFSKQEMELFILFPGL